MEELYLNSYSVTSTAWHERLGVADKELIQTNDQWVYLKGMPFHLGSLAMFENLCLRFGKFIKVNFLKFWVEECNLSRIPLLQLFQLLGMSL